MHESAEARLRIVRRDSFCVASLGLLTAPLLDHVLVGLGRRVQGALDRLIAAALRFLSAVVLLVVYLLASQPWFLSHAHLIVFKSKRPAAA